MNLLADSHLAKRELLYNDPRKYARRHVEKINFHFHECAALGAAFWAIDRAAPENAGTDSAARIGMENIATKTPNTTKTRFGIASITKQFTAVLVLQQAAEGRLLLAWRWQGRKKKPATS